MIGFIQQLLIDGCVFRCWLKQLVVSGSGSSGGEDDDAGKYRSCFLLANDV